MRIRSRLSIWLGAARLRTLPLALASIFMGTCLAAADGHYSVLIFVLCLITTLFYQILSNFANDLGDGEKGSDATREGESRAVASGMISASRMRRAVWIMAVLALASGSYLSIVATGNLALWITVGFIALGLLAVLAAVYYTVGPRAYGYRGLGDLSVLIFFGWVGVLGSYFLQTNLWRWELLLPATALGCFAIGVLNVNNMRDLEQDRKNNKQTLAVWLGARRAKIYHALLIIVGFDLAFLFNRLYPATYWQNLYFIVLPFLLLHLVRIASAGKPMHYEKLLPQLAIITLVFAITFGLGRLI